MAHVTAPNLRGKGQSATKLTKAGQPKRSGNWSAYEIHRQSLQFKDYYVYVHTDETGIERLVMEDRTTLLADVIGEFGEMIENLALLDPHFNSYRREGEFKGIGNGKCYEAHMTLRKVNGDRYWNQDRFAILRMEIYTDGDFKFNFPNY